MSAIRFHIRRCRVHTELVAAEMQEAREWLDAQPASVSGGEARSTRVDFRHFR